MLLTTQQCAWQSSVVEPSAATDHVVALDHEACAVWLAAFAGSVVGFGPDAVRHFDRFGR